MDKREQNTGGQDRVLRCDQCEDMIADALDGSLSEADTAVFRRHQTECALCAQVFRETQQGKAWMEYLEAEPEVPAGLLQAILARTSAVQASGLPAEAQAGVAATGRVAAPLPAWQRARPGVLSLARQVLEPRLMMTVAMAFFSIALTLNLTGIKLTEVHAADLQPARMRANLTRQYYSTNEQVMKYYENLRVVYEMEARVRELRRITETMPRSTTPVLPDATPRSAPRDGSGTPGSNVPRGQAAPGGEAAPTGQAAPSGEAAPGGEAAPSGEENPSALAVGFPASAYGRTCSKEVCQATALRKNSLQGANHSVTNPGVANHSVENRAERILA